MAEKSSKQNKMYNLFLDDKRFPEDCFEYTHYTDGTFKEKTGYSCAKWLLDYCMDNKLLLPKHILVHSMNPIGGENIKSLFDTYNKIYGK